MEEKKLRIVFFGTPEFAVASLSRLVEDGCDIAAVVTMPDKVAGRGHKVIQSDVKRYALEKGLRVLQPERLKSPEFVDELRAIDADLFIVIAFRMLPEVVWGMPPLGTFNLHASLLPKYRGAAPINWAVMNGDTETGVTCFFLKHEIDTGDMIGQRKIEILPSDNVGTVHDKLMKIGTDMVSQTVKDIAEGRVSPVPQPEGEFIAAPKIFKDTCHIDWNSTSARIHNQVRGLSPYPAAWTTMEDSRYPGSPLDVKIFETRIAEVEEPCAGEPGEVSVTKDSLYVRTSDGILEILSLQPAGKRRMDSSSFLRGYNPLRFF